MSIIHRFNHHLFLQLLERDEMLLTTTEKELLLYMLQQEPTVYFFSEEERLAWQNALGHCASIADAITVQGRAQNNTINGEMVQQLRNGINEKQLLTIDYMHRSGKRLRDQGMVYKLYYVAHNESWYIWWGTLQKDGFHIQMTPIELIEQIQHERKDDSLFAQLEALFMQKVEHIDTVRLKLTSSAAQLDEQRFIQAFTAFHKTIERQGDETYIEIQYVREDEAYLLSKIRSFGPHIVIVSPEAMRDKMRMSIAKSLARYNH